jgi:hypothetical protein
MKAAWGIGLLGALTAALLAGNGPAGGDAAVYIEQARAGAFDRNPVHIGYLLLARAALAVHDDLLAMDLLSAASLVVLAVGAARLARDLAGEGTGVAAVSCMALALPLAPFAEVDLPMAAAMCGAMVVDGAIPALLLTAAACAISPGALPWVPAALVARRRGRLAPVLGVALWAAVMAPWASEIVGGSRGFAAAWATRMPVGRALAESFALLVPAALAPLMFVGAVASGPGRRLDRVATVAFVAAWLTLARIPSVPGQLATIPLAAAVAGRGASVVTRLWPGAGRLAVLGLLVGAVATGFRAADLRRIQVRRENEVLAALAERLAPGEVVVAPWRWGVRLAHARGIATSEGWSEQPGAGRWVLPPGATVAGVAGTMETLAGVGVWRSE